MALLLSRETLKCWTVVLLGLFYICVQSDARAVNVSNTWTMPQEGLNVFYRFFRDRISWFEADAVCQFHHANLVTVDNSFQFDATRDLLRELDVNDIVWIGLMRPQSTDRFMWSNSRPLVTDTGYWAESLPLMESPLCAVIDPIRDYRWHALRCGGPETASFLCEMPVPSWADACILKDMPNLTMQYMADTASIELIRNCEEEGLLRQSCKGKQDRERAIQELICPRERLEAQRINDITNSHFKSLQIINSIRTDNNENNDIELLPMGESYGPTNELGERLELQTEKNTVQRLIEQFNVDELMQADEPHVGNGGGFLIPGEIPKPVKKAGKGKKVPASDEYTKKEKVPKYSPPEQPGPQKQQMMDLEDMMMGDQPHGEPEVPDPERDDDASNEIMAPLPHKKKILPQDLKTMPTITEAPEIPLAVADEEKTADMPTVAASVNIVTTSTAATTTTSTTTTAAPTISTTTIPNTTPAIIPTTTSTTTTTKTSTSLPTSTTSEPLTTTPQAAGSSEEIKETTSSTEAPASSTSSSGDEQPTTVIPVATMPPATIGHPMHPQQPRSNIFTEEAQHPHVKESADNSHFIPPMLLVKSHYVPPLKHEHGGPAEHHEHHNEQPATTLEERTIALEEGIAVVATSPGTTTIEETHARIIERMNHGTNNAETQEEKQTTAVESVRDINNTQTSQVNGERTTPAITAATSPAATQDSTTSQHPTEQHETTTHTARKPLVETTPKIVPTTAKHVIMTSTMERSTSQETAPTTVATTPEATVVNSTPKHMLEAIITTQKIASATPTTAAETTTKITTTALPVTAVPNTTTTGAPTTTSTEASTTEGPPTPTTTHNFLREDTEAPFKPNRRRSLTKPEPASYFKKILG